MTGKGCTLRRVQTKGRALRPAQRHRIHQVAGQDFWKNTELLRPCLRGFQLPRRMSVTNLNLQLRQVISKQKCKNTELEFTHSIVSHVGYFIFVFFFNVLNVFLMSLSLNLRPDWDYCDFLFVFYRHRLQRFLI